MEEPKGLASRPHFGGLPVPFITAIIDGTPDFKVHDVIARANCATQRLCQLCGQPFGDEPTHLAFIGTIRTVLDMRFGEPPAHPECLQYAWDVCPWLAGREYAGTDAARRFRRVAPPKPPEMMGVLFTDRYWLVEDDEGATDFKFLAGAPTRPIEWRERGKKR